MKNIRIAILGTAKIARTVGPGIQAAQGAELVGVASRDLDKARAFADDLNIPQVYDGYQKALDDPDVDAVYMPLPPSLHVEWVTRAAEAGKHILCEKPMARNALEVDQMRAVCRQHGVVLLDGVMWYHTPRAAEIGHVVGSGQLGTVRQLTSVFTFHWDTMPMDNIRLQREMGGGSLLDLGWYCVGATLLLFQDLPTEVYARAKWCNDVDTRLNAFLWFDDGRTATIECGFDTVRRRWLEIAGTQAALVCDDFTRPWKPEKPRFWIHDNDGVSTERVIAHKPQEECMIEAFCDLIRSGRTDHPWQQLARNTQAVCDAIDQSARSNQPVLLPKHA